MEKDPTQPNFYEVSQERKSLRETLKESESLDVPEKIIENTKTELKTVQEKARKFKLETTDKKVEIKNPDGTSEEVDVHNFSKAKELLREQKEEAEKSKWIDEVAILKEMGADYEILSKSQDELSALSDFEISRLRKAQFNPYARKSYENIREEILKEKIALAGKINNIETKNTTAFRASELVSYNKGLHQEGHIAPVGSVKESLAKIGRKMISGKPMFLHGPAGTGKTSLARYAAKHFTGKDAEMVSCTPQTREANIWGKTGIRPAEGEAGRHGAIQTVDIYGPLAKAAKEGKAVIFDEFTALPKEQMSFIKGILNAKIGDSINLVGNGKTEIAPGFQMIFTANLKSEKNPERQEMPPEIAREFEQNNLKIEYNSPDETYDIMLARLMNKDGSVDASYYDLNQTLPKLCEAMAEIQIAYVNKESDATARLTGTKDASGKTQGLKKLVMTQGTVENILNDWRTEKQIGTKLSFAEFLDTCLKTGLTFEEYPEKDRILAAKILASKGFLRTLTAKDLNLPQAVFDVDAIKKLRGEEAVAEIKEKSKNEKHISLKELVELDTFGKRRKKAAETAGLFLPEEGKKKESSGETSLEKAREIMGENFLGPEAVKNVFGVELDIPIPCFEEDLERAKELNQTLVLYIDTMEDKKGKLVPVNLKKLKSKFPQAHDGKNMWYDQNWYNDEDFFKKETPRVGWKLVSKEIIPDSTSKNYLEQTETIVKYLKEDVFKGKQIPDMYQEAIDEFESQKSDIAEIIDSDWKSAADKLEKLKITLITREKPVEVKYRLILQDQENKEKLLPSKYTWTLSRDSDGRFVDVGGFDSDGAYVHRNAPGDWSDALGVSFSRSL